MRASRLFRADGRPVPPAVVAGAAFAGCLICLLVPKVLPGTGLFGMLRPALLPAGLLLFSVTLLVCVAALERRLSRVRSGELDAIGASLGKERADRVERYREGWALRVRAVQVVSAGLGAVLLVVGVPIAALAAGRIGGDLLEGPETFHVEHCYGPWDRGRAPDGVSVPDDRLALVDADGRADYVHLGDGPVDPGVRRACRGGGPVEVRLWRRTDIIAGIVPA